MSFQDIHPNGDVEIQLSTTDDKIILHGTQLTMHSPWFKASLSERWKTGNEATTPDGKTYWVYELRFEKDSDMGILIRKTTSATSTTTNAEFILGSKGKLPDNTTTAQRELHNRRLQCLKAHKDLLGAFYFFSPSISRSSFESAWASILSLAALASMYDCEKVVSACIENALLIHQMEILKTCVSAPLDMLELATAVKSDWIFMEATTNLLGRSWRYLGVMQPRITEIGLSDLMLRKRAAFVLLLETVELLLFKIQPNKNNWMSRMAVNYFKEWLSQQLIDGKGSSLSPGYGGLYYSIKQQRTVTPPSRKGALEAFLNEIRGAPNGVITRGEWQELEAQLRSVFEQAWQVIEPVTRDKTMRQDKTPDTCRSLTCMEVQQDELPWIRGSNRQVNGNNTT